MRAPIAIVALALALAAGCKGEGGGAGDEQLSPAEQYVGKAKSTEATMLIRRMASGARAYYLDPPFTGMSPAPPRFPGPSVGPTPPLGACCRQEKGRCAPNAELWEHPVWRALYFEVSDPHYYSYEYVVSDDGQSFTAQAFGDLDCDGVYSTFAVIGHVEDDGNPSVSTAILRINELE
jgi:hypothetical protein